MKRMRDVSKRLLWGGAAMLLCAGAWAGVPQPGIVLYGQVLGEDNALLTEGELTWTFTASPDGEPLTITTTLGAIDGPGGPFSYKTIVPFEASLAEVPSLGGAIPVGVEPVEYVRDGAVGGTPVTMSHNIFISAADISSVQRVDVCIGCDPIVMTKHSADINGDFRFSLSEFLRVVELHTADSAHEYHISGSTMDGFSVGTGPRTGYPQHGRFHRGRGLVDVGA